jgi:hypothetical protein
MAIDRRVLAVLLLLGGATPARAHVVYGTPSLHEQAREADLVVRVRIAHAQGLLRSDAPAATRSVVDAVVLETLRGERLARVTFAPHGHGAAEYHDGEEALVLLRRIGRVPELAASPLSGLVRWVSVQETGDKVPLGGRSRRLWLDAVRRWLDADAIADAARREAALRETTIALLASPEPRIAASALRDLVWAGDAPVVTRDDVPRLDPLLRRPSVPITVRVGLLAELERRRLVAGAPRWARLLDDARGAGRLVVIRAVAAHPSPEVNARLLRVLDGGDREVAAAAAVSLGVPGNAAAVAPLERLLARDDAGLRFAAIRGLGRIGGAEALAALQRAAAFHPDAATRRRAGAEATVVGSRSAPHRGGQTAIDDISHASLE